MSYVPSWILFETCMGNRECICARSDGGKGPCDCALEWFYLCVGVARYEASEL